MIILGRLSHFFIGIKFDKIVQFPTNHLNHLRKHKLFYQFYQKR